MQAVKSALFSVDGSSVLTASRDCSAKIWSTATGECTQTFEGHFFGVLSAVFSADGNSVLTASYDQTAKIWDIATGECTQTFSQPHFRRKSPEEEAPSTARSAGSTSTDASPK